ncbi:hypothetical protein DFH05DRAFT_1559991 [Lentinula detonsa]|uniref:Uncharacterized protein n=1 Tax=Lentinula detonsa TaxID=2804962 RepID=A0A9W8NT28_9AGAR|nr:hypothetical protein DFH05DRAFT_1559991 [Lentinula detonsa]
MYNSLDPIHLMPGWIYPRQQVNGQGDGPSIVINGFNCEKGNAEDDNGYKPIDSPEEADDEIEGIEQTSTQPLSSLISSNLFSPSLPAAPPFISRTKHITSTLMPGVVESDRIKKRLAQLAIDSVYGWLRTTTSQEYPSYLLSSNSHQYYPPQWTVWSTYPKEQAFAQQQQQQVQEQPKSLDLHWKSVCKERLVVRQDVYGVWFEICAILSDQGGLTQKIEIQVERERELVTLEQTVRSMVDQLHRHIRYWHERGLELSFTSLLLLPANY